MHLKFQMTCRLSNS